MQKNWNFVKNFFFKFFTPKLCFSRFLERKEIEIGGRERWKNIYYLSRWHYLSCGILRGIIVGRGPWIVGTAYGLAEARHSPGLILPPPPSPSHWARQPTSLLLLLRLQLPRELCIIFFFSISSAPAIKLSSKISALSLGYNFCSFDLVSTQVQF